MKLFQKLLSAALTASLALGACTFEVPEASAASNAVALVDSMGMGWNLGNTFDSGNCKAWVSNDPYVDTEVGWGNPRTTSAMISGSAAAGFDTVRIPVTWAENIDASGNVDPDYLARIKEVVDYCFKAGMKAIINVDKTEEKDVVIAKAKEALGDKLTGNIVKEIYVPGRIVNIVCK